jgi:hypothetical protein
MKKTVLILAFLVCFISYHGFAGGSKQTEATKANTAAVEASTQANTLATAASRANTAAVEAFTILAGEPNTPVPGEKIPPGQGDQKEQQSSNQETADRIPVNSKIVEFLSKNEEIFDELTFYLSKEFTLKINEHKETAEVEHNNGMIILNQTSTNNETEKKFPVDSKGKLHKNTGRELEIFFKDQGRILIFRENVQRNCYELFSVKIGDTAYKAVQNVEPPQLLIHGKNEQKMEVRVFPVTALPADNQSRNAQFNAAQSYQNINAGSFNDSYRHTGDYNRTSRSIMGRGSVTPQGVIAYAKKKNPALNKGDIAIINKYFDEAGYEGVNADIAIAQMLHWTNNLKNRERVATRNYGGLSRIDNWNGKFPYRMRDGLTEGVRAHIQHLKAYANEPPIRDIVDPRYRLAVQRGFRGMRFEDLYRHWTARPGDYEYKIEAILVGIGSSGARH